MKRPSPLVQRGASTDIDSAMTPMIDVVFLLLVFFVWTASFQIVEQVMPSEMSSQMGAEPIEVEPEPEKDFHDVIVRIHWDGQNPNYSVDKQPVESLDQVQERLKAISAINNEAVVILHPQPEVPVDFVIQSYDAAKLSGFEKVSFAVNQK